MSAGQAAVEDAFRAIAEAVGGEFTPAALQAYARRWRLEERTGEFFIGHPDARDVTALVLAIEGARLLCAVERKSAAAVLRRAADRLESADAPSLSGGADGRS